jgi:hypothetical protein
MLSRFKIREAEHGSATTPAIASCYGRDVGRKLDFIIVPFVPRVPYVPIGKNVFYSS